MTGYLNRAGNVVTSTLTLGAIAHTKLPAPGSAGGHEPAGITRTNFKEDDGEEVRVFSVWLGEVAIRGGEEGAKGKRPVKPALRS